MRSEKSKETEKKIFDSAVELIFEKGYSSATTSEIAKMAGVAEGTIFRYYPNKKEFLHKIVYEVIDRFGERVAIDTFIDVIERNRDEDISDLLKAVVDDRLNIISKNFHMVKILINEIQYHPDIRELLSQKIETRVLPVAEKVINHQIEIGNIRNIDGKVIFRSVASMIFSNFILEMVISEKLDYERLKNNINLSLDIFINGIRKRPDEE